VTFQLGPGQLIEAAAVALEHEPLPAEQVVSGSPTTGILVLDETDDRELGIWEMTPGTATDVEVDEVFIVLAGRATVTGIAPDPVELMPGAVVRLTAGMETTWTVHETLRKIYLV
jgi:uncharacterized cupin superfamily protein